MLLRQPAKRLAVKRIRHYVASGLPHLVRIVAAVLGLLQRRQAREHYVLVLLRNNAKSMEQLLVWDLLEDRRVGGVLVIVFLGSC